MKQYSLKNFLENFSNTRKQRSTNRRRWLNFFPRDRPEKGVCQTWGIIMFYFFFVTSSYNHDLTDVNYICCTSIAA